MVQYKKFDLNVDYTTVLNQDKIPNVNAKILIKQ